MQPHLSDVSEVTCMHVRYEFVGMCAYINIVFLYIYT